MLEKGNKSQREARISFSKTHTHTQKNKNQKAHRSVGIKRWGKGKLLKRSVTSPVPESSHLGSFAVCCSFSALTSVQPVGVRPSPQILPTTARHVRRCHPRLPSSDLPTPPLPLPPSLPRPPVRQGVWARRGACCCLWAPLSGYLATATVFAQRTCGNGLCSG